MPALMARRVIDPANSEALVWHQPLGLKRDGTPIGIVHCHGDGGTELESLSPTNGFYKPIDAIAAAGFPVVASAMGGTNIWGNDTSITRTGQARTFLQNAEVAAHAGKVILSGTSAGFLTVCNWARQNPTLVAGIMGLIFDPALQYSHDTLVGGANAANIETAYGGSGAYTAALPTHDPMQYAASDLKGIPMLLIYSTDDDNGEATPPYQIQQSFIATMSAVSPVEVHTQTGGHSLTNLDTSVIGPWLNWLTTSTDIAGSWKPTRRQPFSGPYAIGRRRLEVLDSPSQPVNLTADSGIATASGATVSIAWAWTSATGAASAGGETVSPAVALTAATGVATAAGSSTTDAVALTAATGTATAGGGTATVASAFVAATGTATASGTAPSIAATLLAATGVASAGGGTATVGTGGDLIAAGGTATTSGTVSLTWVIAAAGATATAAGGTATYSRTLTAASGTATATGSATLTWTLLAATGQSTAAGGLSAARGTLDTTGGLATATGTATTVLYVYSITAGLATADGGAVTASSQTHPTRWPLTPDGDRWPNTASSDRWTPAATTDRWNLTP